MRRLLYLSLGFGTACATSAYLLPSRLLASAFLVSTIIFLISVIVPWNSGNRRRMALLLLGIAAGFGWFSCYHSRYLIHAISLDGKTEDQTIRVSDYSYPTSYGSAFDGTIIIDKKTYQVRTYVNDIQELVPGDTLTGQFRFRITTSDGMEEATYHQGKGIFLIAYQKGEITLCQSPGNRTDQIAHLRVRIKEMLQSAFPKDTYPFAKALLLGDSTDLGYETDTDFKISGIRHIIAVSGLHVTILVTLISTTTFRKRFLTALLGFPILLLFAALAGFTPSVSRACIMSGLMLLAMLFNREYDGITALSFAALVMLLGNPLVITSVSFQLSVGSVAGIQMFHQAIRKWLLHFFSDLKDNSVKTYIVRWLITSVSFTLSAISITTPLCALYFGMISLVGVITNLLTLWVISFIFYGILLVCLLYTVSAAAAHAVALFVSIPIRYILLVARTMANIPLAAVYTCSPYIAAWLIFVYLLLAMFLILRRKHPATLICCGVLGLCFALLASWTEPMLSDLRFTMLDVGQGQCILVQSEGRTFLVDCGGDSVSTAADVAAETLLSQGITKLDCLILTHLDRDHAGGVANLLSRVDTELLILPPETTTLPQSTTGQVIYASDDLILTCGDTVVTIYSPNFPGNSNEKSLCILFDTEKCDILITGDRSGFGERSLLRNHRIPDVDILVAGHHGSKNATSEELLYAVRPEIVCISAGKDNSYGHPAAQLLQRLQEHRCIVYRTDLQGTILIRR